MGSVQECFITVNILLPRKVSSIRFWPSLNRGEMPFYFIIISDAMCNLPYQRSLRCATMGTVQITGVYVQSTIASKLLLIIYIIKQFTQ